MGLVISDVKMFWQAKQAGAAFDSTLTIGRQELFLRPSDVRAIQRLASSQKGKDWLALRNYQYGDYADDFLRAFLGISSLTALDVSSYEGVDLLHDLNDPVPEDLWNRFDAVIDGGSLEHVFNFPTAIGNLMRMTKVGGKIFISTPANNLCGHGFYQFSPELMFRVFSEQNGFSLERVVLLSSRFPDVELAYKRIGYEVADPAIVRKRVGLLSKEPVMMKVEATKIRDGVALLEPPQQSDYVMRWGQNETASLSALKAIYYQLPYFLRRRILGHYRRLQYSFWNSAFYHRRRI